MADEFARMLKAAGFKKQSGAMYFRRTRPGGVIEVVHVRANALTAGVYFPELAHGRVKGAPQDFDCIVSMPFDVSDSDVVDVWTTRIAPWLASVTDVPSLHRALDVPGAVGPRYDLLRPARIAVAVGDRVSAQRRVDALIASIHAKRTGPNDTFGAVVIQEAVAFAHMNGLTA